MKLRRNQYCPIHRSLSCCGRETIPRIRKVNKLGVQRIEDPNHPRGYRELRSNAEMRRLLNRKVVQQNSECALCRVKFANYNDIVPDHINPRGMGGALAQRPSRQHSGGAVVVQRGQGIEQSLNLAS
jgi:hypothetical protein